MEEINFDIKYVIPMTFLSDNTIRKVQCSIKEINHFMIKVTSLEEGYDDLYFVDHHFKWLLYTGYITKL